MQLYENIYLNNKTKKRINCYINNQTRSIYLLIQKANQVHNIATDFQNRILEKLE